MTTPPADFDEKVRQHIKAATGEYPASLKVRDVFLGTDSNVTWDQRAEAVAKALLERAQGSDRPPMSGRPKVDVREFVKTLKTN